MTWEDKTQLVTLLNQGRSVEAMEFYLQHEVWHPWNDVQALSMFANGISLAKPQTLKHFEDKLREIQLTYPEVYSNLDFRASLRLVILQDCWDLGITTYPEINLTCGIMPHVWHLKDEFGLDVAFIKVPSFGTIERRQVSYLTQDVHPITLTREELYFKYSKDATIHDFLALQDFTRRVSISNV